MACTHKIPENGVARHPAHPMFIGLYVRRLWAAGLRAWLSPIAMLFVVSVVAAENEVRTWTDQTGSITKQGSLDRVEKNWVHLRLSEGGTVRVPLAWLSDADQAYVRQQGSAPPTADALPGASGGSRQPSKPASDYTGDLVTVTTEGVGVDKKSAEEDAWRAAIRQVVGGYVDSETIVENDQLIRDTVITLSSAYVERATTKRTRNQDGLFYVTVEAAVQVTKLLDTLEQHSVAIAQVDPETIRDAIARAQTQEEQEQARTALISRALRNYPENCMRVSIEGKPEISSKAVTFRIKVEPDMEAFAAIADKLVESLASTTRRNGVRRSSGEFVDPYAGDDGGRRRAQEALLRVIEGCFPNVHQVVVQDKANDSPRTTCAIPSVFSAKVETENGLQHLAHANGQWQSDQHQTFLYVPYRANKSLSRITWRWFLINEDEFEQILKPLIHRVEFRSDLLDENGDQLSDDMTIMFYGWSGVNMPGTTPSFGQRVVVAPFAVGASDDCYAPSFSFGRRVSLAPEELQAIRTVECSVQAGSQLWQKTD